jgi:hypothetical protein
MTCGISSSLISHPSSLVKRYKSFTENTGVTGYEAGRDYIRVRFKDRSIYRYTYRSTGANKIEEMKRLAEEGDGLTTYINRYVREAYEEREG